SSRIPAPSRKPARGSPAGPGPPPRRAPARGAPPRRSRPAATPPRASASSRQRHLRDDQPEIRPRPEAPPPGCAVHDDLLEELEPGLLLAHDLGRFGVELLPLPRIK